MKFKTFLVSFLLTCFFSVQALAQTKIYGNGFLEIRGDIPVLHLKGSEYEMGKQYGYLAGERILANVENLKAIADHEDADLRVLPPAIFTWLRRIVGMVFWVTFPKDVQIHINGIKDGAKAAGVKLNKFDVAFINSIIDIVGIKDASSTGIGSEKAQHNWLVKVLGLTKFTQNCDSFAAWGARTVDGKTFQTRNTDITTGAGIERYPIAIIYKPDGKIPFMTSAFSGMVGVFTGMNAYGVSLGQIWAFSKDVKLATPWNIMVRDFFAQKKSAKEMLESFKKAKTTTYGNNFIIADAGGHLNSDDTGYAIEMTGKSFAYFIANDQRELEAKYQGESYGYPISNAVFRGDLSLDAKVRSRQLAAAGPEGDPRSSGASYTERYKGQYDRIIAYEKAGVLIGKEQAEAISRETAARGSSLQAAVYANSDRNFWVSYSKILDDGSVLQAYEREYVNIPFYTYLADLKLFKNRVLVKSWFKDRKALKLKYINRSKEVSETIIDLKERVTQRTEIKLAKGEVVELYEGDLLIERLARK